MVIYECHQMLAPVDTPLFRAKLTIQGMGDFKKIHIVKTGEQPFVTFIVRAAMEHFIIDDLIVVPKQNFPNESEVRF